MVGTAAPRKGVWSRRVCMQDPGLASLEDEAVNIRDSDRVTLTPEGALPSTDYRCGGDPLGLGRRPQKGVGCGPEGAGGTLAVASARGNVGAALITKLWPP